MPCVLPLGSGINALWSSSCWLTSHGHKRWPHLDRMSIIWLSDCSQQHTALKFVWLCGSSGFVAWLLLVCTELAFHTILWYRFIEAKAACDKGCVFAVLCVHCLSVCLHCCYKGTAHWHRQDEHTCCMKPLDYTRTATNATFATAWLWLVCFPVLLPPILLKLTAVKIVGTTLLFHWHVIVVGT